MSAWFVRFISVIVCVLLCIGMGVVEVSADAGIFEGSGVGEDDIRKGNITFDDIPNMIMAVTNWVLGIAATIAVFAIIFGALKLTLGSGALGGSDGKTEAKNALQYGITGFVVAVSAWLIVQFVLSNL